MTDREQAIEAARDAVVEAAREWVWSRLELQDAETDREVVEKMAGYEYCQDMLARALDELLHAEDDVETKPRLSVVS